MAKVSCTFQVLFCFSIDALLFLALLFCPCRIVEDFRDWTNWLLYRGGIGVKGEESWEAWWDEELVLFDP